MEDPEDPEEATRRKPLPSILDSVPGEQKPERTSYNSVNTAASRNSNVLVPFPGANKIDAKETKEEADEAYKATYAGHQINNMGGAMPKEIEKPKPPNFFERMFDTFGALKRRERVDPNGENEITWRQEILILVIVLAVIIIIIIVAVSLS